MRILIIKMSSLGDVVHAIPVARAIKQALPHCRVEWLVEEGMEGVLACVPQVERIHIWPRRQWMTKVLKPSNWREVAGQVRSFVAGIRTHHYDLVLDLQGLFKSAVWLLAARCHKRALWDGTSESRFHLFARRIKVSEEDLHAVERNLQVAQQLVPISGEARFELTIPLEATRSVSVKMKEAGWENGRPYCVLIPNARWESKLWLAERFAQVADNIQKRWDMGVVLVGSPKDRVMNSRIAAKMRRAPVELTAKTTLVQLMALLKGAHCVVSVDSGPMHLAAALGVPVIAIFGPTAPWRTGPYGKGHRVLRAAVPCSPCFKTRCKLKTCMTMLSSEQVEEALDQVINGNAG
jgi:lipopolysaccharide heptosyltransferase I